MGDSEREVGATNGEGEDGEDRLEGVDVEEEEASLTEAESPPRVESWTKKNRFFSFRTIGGHKKTGHRVFIDSCSKRPIRVGGFWAKVRKKIIEQETNNKSPFFCRNRFINFGFFRTKKEKKDRKTKLRDCGNMFRWTPTTFVPIRKKSFLPI